MADRFYCPAPPVDGRLTLEGDEARHLTRVRRVELGEIVEVFDGRGHVYQAEVTTIGRESAGLTIQAFASSRRLPACRITLASAVPKGDRFDWLVEKATEIGVARLIPLVTDRSVVDPRSAKLDRLRRVVVEAAKQSNRDHLMDIDPPTPWLKVLGALEDATGLVAHPGGRPVASFPVVWGSSVILAVGPEGGFTDDEVELAVQAGWRLADLGPTLLRVETAGLAGCSTLLAMGEAVREPEDVT